MYGYSLYRSFECLFGTAIEFELDDLKDNSGLYATLFATIIIAALHIFVSIRVGDSMLCGWMGTFALLLGIAHHLDVSSGYWWISATSLGGTLMLVALGIHTYDLYKTTDLFKQSK